MKSPTPNLSDLQALLRSLDALRNGRAFALLLGTLCLSGLCLASIEPALAQERLGRALAWAGLALATLIYGVNASGALLMDEALGRPRREALEALYGGWGLAHRVLLALLLQLLPALLLLGLLGLLLAATRWLGPWWLLPLMPVAVLLLGGLALWLLVWLGPLTGPVLWSGQGLRAGLAWLTRAPRRLLLRAALLKLALLGLVGGFSLLTSFVMLSGARVLALAAGPLGGFALPPQQVLAHLFGYGLRALGASGAPVVANAHAQAIAIGGGMLVAVALVLPALVYLRGCCAIYLCLRDER